MRKTGPEHLKKGGEKRAEVRFVPDSYSAESLSERILDSIAHGAFTINLDYEITSFNRAAENITGFLSKDVIGMKCYDMFRANICQTNCALKRSLESGKDVYHQRAVIKDIDGDDVPLIVTSSVLRDGELNRIGGVEIFRDISTSVSRLQNISEKYTSHNIISKDEKIHKILSTLPDIAKSDSTVLIQGPSGSGKELFAKAIHDLSGRKGNFIALNCAALPDTLLESELFGYKKGAFTGATRDKLGRFSLAEKGTIFLDEIGDISPALQLKLLRVLQEREFEPLGATTTIKADVRVIAATNKNLKELMDEGTFRDDLYFRLNIITISLPTLAERKQDIPLLIHYFIDKFNRLKHKEIDNVSPRVFNLLMQYDYPGNIRELENIIEYCFVLCNDNVIRRDSLPEGFVVEEDENILQAQAPEATPLSDAEASTILEALHTFNGNRRQTALHLGIDKTTLWRKMKKYKIVYPTKK
ncbi:MAG TPA: Fis family transcriptional regulator [Desulfobacteraceae bacterium]|nr:Fis family transcriptional regulator [Desulfobacteraceae bacterium]